MDKSATVRMEEDLIPRGAQLIQDAVTEFQPESDTIKTQGGKTIKYKKLVVCAGLQLNWGAVKGLQETLGKNKVTSNYR